MDLNNLFRSFFGSNHDNYGNNDIGQDFDDLESHFHRDFEDIVRTFGQMFQVLNRSAIFEDLNDENRWQQIDEQNKSPRDLMIKPREEMDQQRQMDFDLDQRVDKNGLNELFSKRHDLEPNIRHNPIQTKSFTKTYFYSNFSDNEQFEEQTTTNDELGNIETSITKRIGDRWLTKVIKKNNKNEIMETKEITNFEPSEIQNFQNIDQKPQLEGEKPRNVIIEQNQNKGFWLKDLISYFFK